MGMVTSAGKQMLETSLVRAALLYLWGQEREMNDGETCRLHFFLAGIRIASKTYPPDYVRRVVREMGVDYYYEAADNTYAVKCLTTQQVRYVYAETVESAEKILTNLTGRG